MTERPILMSAPMVLACLREVDPKTQTRRLLKPQPTGPLLGQLERKSDRGVMRPKWWFSTPDRQIASDEWACPYGVPGDVLWVKERHRFDVAYDHLKPTQLGTLAAVFYEAGGQYGDGVPGKSRVSIHMRRCFSRISLRITDVRVERLNEIDDSDSVAEGVGLCADGGFEVAGMGEDASPICCQPTARQAYRCLWERINGPGSWDANPWVWAVSFERI